MELVVFLPQLLWKKLRSGEEQKRAVTGQEAAPAAHKPPPLTKGKEQAEKVS